jgi:hypothetical protein
MIVSDEQRDHDDRRLLAISSGRRLRAAVR